MSKLRAIIKHAFFLCDASNPEQKEFRIGASKDPQEIPEWVTKTPTFLRGLETGAVFEVNETGGKKGKKEAEYEKQIEDLKAQLAAASKASGEAANQAATDLAEVKQDASDAADEAATDLEKANKRNKKSK